MHAVRVLLCVRSVDSPSVLSCLPRSPRWAISPATCGGPGTPRPRTSSRPSTRPVGVHRSRPGQAARRGRAATGSRSWPRTQAFLAQLSAAQRRPEQVPHRRPLVPAPGRRGRRLPEGDRLLLARSSASPRCCRSTPAASASSPATTSRRRATSACRSSASGCSTGTATSSRRSPARAGSRRPTRSSTPTACRSRCCARRTASARRSASRVPGGPDLVARIFVASVGRVPLLMLDTDVEGNPDHYREVTDRLYGGTSEHRLRQELLLGVGGVRALRAFSPDHRAPGARGVPHQRGPRRLPRPGADPRAHRRRGRPEARLRHRARGRPRVAPSSPRTPRCPPASTASRATLVEQYFGDAGPTPGVPGRPDPARSAAEDYEGGDPSVFNMAVMGFRLAQRANGVSQLHGHVSRGMFSGLWPAFDEAEVPISSITNGVHAPTWVAREVFELAVSQGADPESDDTDGVLGRGRQGPQRRHLGDQAPAARAARRRTPASGWPARARSAAPPRPSSAGSRPPSTPTC